MVELRPARAFAVRFWVDGRGEKGKAGRGAISMARTGIEGARDGGLLMCPIWPQCPQRRWKSQGVSVNEDGEDATECSSQWYQA